MNIQNVPQVDKRTQSPREFLEFIFGKDLPNVQVCGFPGDPAHGRWGGAKYGAGGHALLSPDNNGYFVVSTFTRGRNETDFVSLFVLMADDIGDTGSAKIPHDELAKALGVKRLTPSFRLQTSPGNWQYGFVFKEPVQPHSLATLIEHRWREKVMQANGGKDPGSANLTRYVRTPGGINGKPEYMTNGKPFILPAAEYIEDRKFDARVLATKVLGITDDEYDRAAAGEYVAGMKPALTGADYDDVAEDPSGWGQVLQEEGLLRANPKRGVWDVSCPFVADHSDGRDDGCAYLGDGHFKCFHSCPDEDFKYHDKLEDQHPGIKDKVQAVRQDLARAQFNTDVDGAQDALGGTPPPKWVREMNDRYALVFTGSTYSALRLSSLKNPDPRKGLTFLKIDEKGLHMEFANDLIQTGTKKTNGVEKPVLEVRSKAWVKQPGRKVYTSVGMWPPSTEPAGALNLYRGFTLAPAPGDWSELREFMEKVLCDGDKHLLEWLLDLLAYKFQNPLARAGVCPIFRGKMRTGKTFFTSFIRRFFGWHGAAITRKDDVLGSFNALIHGKLMLELSEATFAGDRSIAGPLKALVTDEDIRITYKGVDTMLDANRLLAMMTTNESWAVPKELGDTRYPVFNVSDSKRANMPYFAGLGEHLGLWPRGVDKPGFQHTDRGAAAFLHDMLERDVSQFNPEGAPATVGGVEQLLETMSGPARWWAEVLLSGEPPRSGYHSTTFPEVTADDWRKGQVHLPRGTMHAAYNNWVEKVNKSSTFHRKEQGFSSATGFYKALTNAAGTAPTGLPYKRGRKRFGQQNEHTDHLLSLDDCRQAFAAASGQHRGDMDVWGWE